MIRLRLIVATIAATFTLALGAARTSADWIETYTGGYDQTWTYIYNAPPSNTSDSTTGDKLTLLGNAGATFDDSVAGLVQTQSFADVRVRATVSPAMGTSVSGATTALATNNDVFVAARSNGIEAYLLTFDYHDGDIVMVRVNNVGAVIPFLGSIVDNPSWFNASESYQLDLRVLGNVLTGRVLDSDGNLLETLVETDSNLLSGWSGIGAAVNADSPPTGVAKTKIAAMFDDVSSTAIPEPSTMFLSIIGAMAAFVVIRRRSRP